MASSTITALYGRNEVEPTSTKPLNEATNEFEIRTQGKHFARIKSGKETVDVPRAQYVKALEDRVEVLEKELKRNEVTNRKLTTGLRSLEQDISELRKELKTKMDRF